MAVENPQDYREMTREELYDLASERDIEGRSQLSKDGLIDALEREDIGPEATRLLESHHDQIRRLFDQFEQLGPDASQRKQEVVRELITTLVKHSEVEEQVFYPVVREELADTDAEMDENLEEHHAAELLMSELDTMRPDAPRYDAKVKVLIENLTIHLDEEEQDLFPRVREELSEERRREIGSAMVKVWQVAPTRPHPHSPQTPPGNLITGLPATVVDLGVGVVRTATRTATRLVRRG